jgi:hypothetical protein
VSGKPGSSGSQASDARLWNGRLQKRREQLAQHARRRAWSGGDCPAGRVLELIDERLEQQYGQQMSQHVGLGGARVETLGAAR